jgi:hypothetical protein
MNWKEGNAYRLLVGEPEGKRLVGIPRHTAFFICSYIDAD